MYCQFTGIYFTHLLVIFYPCHHSLTVFVIAGVSCSTEVNRMKNSLLVTHSDVGVLPAQTHIYKDMVGVLYIRAL